MIIIFGGSGTLGTDIIESLKNKNALCIVANKRYSDVVQHYSNKPNIKKIFKVNLENKSELDFFLSESIKEYHYKISGIVLNFAKTLNQENLDYSIEAEKVFRLNYGASATIYSFFSNLLQNQNSQNKFRAVNVLSNAISTLNASSVHYLSSKAAIERMSSYYAKQYAKQMIINNVLPGLMPSSLTKQRYNKISHEIIKKTPIGRLSEPSEVAEIVRYLVSEVPLSVTGQSIYVDGGRTL